MAAGKMRFMVLLMATSMMLLQVSMATVYKVGDEPGWTTMGNVDYQKWSSSKTFRVGDVILFTYKTQYHNVMQVTHPQYQACNVTAPLKTFTTGNDSITITRNGHYYYLCGFPDHCQQGQKVDIRVARLTTASSATSPAASPSSAPANTPASPKNSAAIPSIGVLGKSMVLVLTIFAGFGF
ncbi:hypothetical protein C5167_014288 [Papaver somniferum]|uniref:Phytocyanin domain-containing protein n=1 Tax=Papaver somniferum TaxID=3469 RepID=A0A4Y7J669_PAPSO|nr:mavicyanin-like [Papaver somniferum]RZC55441.1 hypothetical protein C5167_014288 [Papaver somniferum]